MIERLSQYASDGLHRLMGLMSGTSVDSVDAVIVELSGSGRETRWRLLQYTQYPLPPVLREAILAVSGGRDFQAPDPSKSGLHTNAIEFPVSGSNFDSGGLPATGRLTLLNSAIAEVFATAALACLSQANAAAHDVHLIASHGQTIYHLPEQKCWRGVWGRGTLQLGNGAVIAARTRLPVLCDFRSADMALGGQGAPLVPYADWVLFSQPREVIAVQNLGGIGNVTYLEGTEMDKTLAFDTGPANMLIDGAIRYFSDGADTFDRDGALARQGKVSPELLAFLLSHPYMEMAPPKSTGREDFGEEYLTVAFQEAARLGVSRVDIAATFTAIGPEAAVRAYHRFLPHFPEVVILGGGGSRNPVVVEHFHRLCSGGCVKTVEDYQIPSQAKEALAFAILANETMLGRPSNVPSATGASGRAILGCLYLPPEA